MSKIATPFHRAAHLASSIALLLCTSSAIAYGQPKRVSPPATIREAPRSVAQVTVVMIRSLDDPTAHAQIVRRPRGADRDVILLTYSATADDLAFAIRSFARIRARIGDGQSSELRTFVGSPESIGAMTGNELRFATETLYDVRRAKLTSVAGVGQARAARIAVKPFEGRVAQK